MSAKTRYAEVKQHENHNISIGILIGIMAIAALVAVACSDTPPPPATQVERKPEPLYPRTRISPLDGIYYNMGSLDGETWIVIDEVKFITNHSEIPATDESNESAYEQQKAIAKKYEAWFYSAARQYYKNPTDSMLNVREKRRRRAILEWQKVQRLALDELNFLLNKSK